MGQQVYFAAEGEEISYNSAGNAHIELNAILL